MNIYRYMIEQVNTLGNVKACQVSARVLATRAVGTATGADVLAEMPKDSPCGADCAVAIDRAVNLCSSVLEAVGDDHPEYFTSIFTIAVDCCVTFIRG